MLGKDLGFSLQISAGSDHSNPSGIDLALSSLVRALVDHQVGTPEQAAAWEAGVARLPQPFRNLLPALSCLNELAQKAWPSIKE